MIFSCIAETMVTHEEHMIQVFTILFDNHLHVNLYKCLVGKERLSIWAIGCQPKVLLQMNGKIKDLWLWPVLLTLEISAVFWGWLDAAGDLGRPLLKLFDHSLNP